MSSIGGTVFIKADGDALEVMGSCTIGRTSTVRESVIGANGVVGHITRHRAPFIEVEVATVSGFDPKALYASVNGSADNAVTAELANGDVLVLSPCWMVGEPDENPIEGTCTLRFEGKEMQSV